MFDIGFSELLICAIVALLVLGPERLPGAVRTVGRWVGRARHTVNQFTEQIDREIRAEELRKRIDEEMQKAGLQDVGKQVSDALKAPLPLVGAEHLRAAGQPAGTDESVQATESAANASPAQAEDHQTAAIGTAAAPDRAP